VLRDHELTQAEELSSVDSLRAYVSNRTISVYDQPHGSRRRFGSTIDTTTRGREHRVVIRRNIQGRIIAEDPANGSRRLWVSYSTTCVDRWCAYGFVRTEDGRYRLETQPELDGFEQGRAYRSYVGKRRKLSKGKLRSLSDLNAVYRLQRRHGRHRTVFLELKKKDQKRITKDKDKPGGWPSGPSRTVVLPPAGGSPPPATGSTEPAVASPPR
jgi:hypothetical protein